MIRSWENWMRIIAKKTLREYWEKHPVIRSQVEAWYDHASKADWRSPEDLQRDYGRGVILPDYRAVFNLKGNEYRLVVRINYQAQIIFIRFIGTHAEYDKIDATNI